MIDPIRLELIKNALVMVSDNMMVSVLRTSRSTLIKSNMDFSASILDGAGNMVAQGLALPGHLGATMPALQGCLDHRATQLAGVLERLPFKAAERDGQELPVGVIECLFIERTVREEQATAIGASHLHRPVDQRVQDATGAALPVQVRKARAEQPGAGKEILGAPRQRRCHGPGRSG